MPKSTDTFRAELQRMLHRLSGKEFSENEVQSVCLLLPLALPTGAFLDGQRRKGHDYL